MRPMFKVILFPMVYSLLPLIGVAISGVGLLASVFGGGASKKDQQNQQKGQFQFQSLQAASNAATARQNAGFLGIQRDAFTRQQEEVIGDINVRGDSVYAERAALAAAEGFGGGGSARSAQSQIRRSVNRDVTRVRDSLAEQTDLFNAQIQQQYDQANAFDVQATFATQQSNDISIDQKFSFFKPSTWF